MSIAEEIRRELAATEAGFAQLGRVLPEGTETLRGLIARAGRPFDAPGRALTKEELAVVRACAPKDLPMKQCFMNSQQAFLADRSGRLQYFEGFVYTGFLPLEHGWLVLDDRLIVDLTLVRDRDVPRTNRLTTRIIGTIPSDYGYLGVSISKDQLRAALLSNQVYGSVLDNFKDRWPLLRQGKTLWPNHK